MTRLNEEWISYECGQGNVGMVVGAMAVVVESMKAIGGEGQVMAWVKTKKSLMIKVRKQRILG